MKKISEIRDLLKDSEFTTKVRIYFSTKSAGDDYDTYENNYTFSNLNPLTIKAYVREVSPEALVYKQYGLAQTGAVELVCEDRWKNAFENANKIEIDDIEYQVFREGTGQRTLISKRPNKLLRVVLSKKN